MRKKKIDWFYWFFNAAVLIYVALLFIPNEIATPIEYAAGLHAQKRVQVARARVQRMKKIAAEYGEFLSVTSSLTFSNPGWAFNQKSVKPILEINRKGEIWLHGKMIARDAELAKCMEENCQWN